MKKKYLFMATAAIMMAGCASDDLVGDENISSGETPIAFNMLGTSATTRDANNTTNDPSNKAAADKLGNMFIVWGEKNENDGAEASGTNLVFKNYKVSYDATTINSTTSNTNGWEYVGVTPFETGKGISPLITDGSSSVNKQTIKYWDNNASSYTFTAITALESDITSKNVEIEKITGNKTNGNTNYTKYTKGYTVKIGPSASTDKIYFSDRVNVTKQNNASTYAGSSPVTLTFRNFQSKIRFAIYEDIPGYKVKITGVKYSATSGATAASPTSGDNAFYITASQVMKSESGEGAKTTTFTVSYEPAVNPGTQSTPENKVKLTLGDNANTQSYIKGGTTILTADNIGETAATATYDNVTTSGESGNQTTTKNYTSILPNPDNTTPMTLNISYKLISEDTGEEISFSDKTAVVPAAYCMWKPNFAYTYIFKITEESSGLYPITFDACVAEDEVETQYTITTVDEPSITTYSTSSDGTKDAYNTGDVIYAYAQDGTSTEAMASGTMKLYTVTTKDATNFPITEASVKHAIEQAAKSPAPTNPKIVATAKTEGVSYVAIPSEDGQTRTITGMSWTAAESTVYAVEYSKTEGKTTTKTYKIVIINGATTTTQAGS